MNVNLDFMRHGGHKKTNRGLIANSISVSNCDFDQRSETKIRKMEVRLEGFYMKLVYGQ